MAFFNHVIEADISANTYPEPILVKQGDSGRAIIIYPTSGGQPWPIPDGATAVVHILNPMHQSATYEAEITAHEGRQCILFRISAAALLEAGRASMDATVTVNGVTVSTLNFLLDIEPAPASDFPIPTPGGGVTREELDEALRENSTADQKFASDAVGDLAEKTGVKVRPRVCFVDDDGGAPVPTVLYPWMVEHDVPYNFAIATGDIETGGDSFASWADLRAMQADSRVSWSCHAINDDVMADYTPEQMAEKYAQWRRDMTAHGLRSDAITVMYNHGSSVQETIDKVVSKYFRFGFSTTKGINTAPFDSYHMLRVGLFPRDGSYTLAQAKALVDQLVAVGTGVVVFFTHCYFESFDLGGLTELVEYIRAKGVEIAGLEDALQLYDPKTACDCGDWVEASGEPEYRKSIAQATSATAGQKVANSSDQNCVLTVQVSGKRVRATGTAYSNNGMISWLDSEGNVIGCVWQEANKSGDNARFSLELPVPYGATAIMVSGNSGRQLPRVEVLTTGSGGGITAEEAGRIAENKVNELVPGWAKNETKPAYTAEEVGAVSKEYVDEQDDAFFRSIDAANRRIAALEAKPSGVTESRVNEIVGAAESRFSESITEIEQRLDGITPGSGSGTLKKALPILHLYGDMSEMTKDTKVRMPYRWTDPDGFADAGHQETGWADVKWQGNTSLSKAKKNYNITMYKDPLKKNKDKHKYFDGWGKYNKYVLKANATDLSQAKNVVGARIWSAMTKSRQAYPAGLADTANHGAIDGFPCLIYHDGEYLGLYMMTIHKDNMTDLSDKVETNALVAGWGVTHTEIPDAMTPTIQAGVTALKAYMNDANNTFDDIDDYMDKESMIDYIIYTWVFAAVDSMSQENFFYMTYDAAKFYMVMYDMDSTFGNGTMGQTGVSYTVPYITAESKGPYNVDDPTRAMLVHFMNVFQHEIIARYRYLRENILTVDYIMEEVGNIMDAIGGEYKRDNIKWGVSGGALTEWQRKETFTNWIENRLIVVDSDIRALAGDYIECTGITLDRSEITANAAFTLVATKTPANATDDIVWQTSNKNVATVVDGEVTPVDNGTCTITAVCGSHKATCAVTVRGMISWSELATYKITNGVISDSGSNRRLSGNIPVTPGKTYAITWVSGGNAYIDCAIYKSDGTPISWLNNAVVPKGKTFDISIPEAYKEVGMYMRFAIQWTPGNSDIILDVAERDAEWATAAINGTEVGSLGKFAIANATTGVVDAVNLITASDNTNWWAKNPMTYTMKKIPVSEGQTVTVKNASNAAIFFYDSANVGISGNRGANYSLHDYSQVAPAGSAWCFCESRVPNSSLDTIEVVVS